LSTDPRPTGGARIEALDAVRGIAALLVLFSHCYATLPDATQAALALDATPMGLLIHGRPAVIVFFVLSGFVLSLSLLADRSPSYGAFLIRRICRIYLPFAAAILIAATARKLVQPSPIDELSIWFNRDWTHSVDPSLLLSHLGMLGRARDMSLNNPMWSLIVEMRISLIFPLLLALVARSLWVTVPVLLLTLGVTEYLARSPYLPSQPYSGETLLEALLFTLYFLSFFITGILIATQRERAARLVEALGTWPRRLLWLAALGSLAVYDDLVNVVGAGLIVVLVLGSRQAKAWLGAAVLQWLGRISYNLYLTHIIVLLSLVHLFHGSVPLSWLLLAVIPLSLVVADLCYRLVERPSIRLGRLLTRRPIGNASSARR
jgi:peptidoglycan/LPS O-acetylase OafA/YrhL